MGGASQGERRVPPPSTSVRRSFIGPLGVPGGLPCLSKIPVPAFLTRRWTASLRASDSPFGSAPEVPSRSGTTPAQLAPTDLSRPPAPEIIGVGVGIGIVIGVGL